MYFQWDKVNTNNKIIINDHYNENNRLLDDGYIKKLLKTFVKKTIKNINIDLYQLAFVHKSIFNKDPNDTKGLDLNKVSPELEKTLVHYEFNESNERLEFLGDSFLGCIIADYLYHRYPNSDEGFLTDTRIKLVKHDTLAEFSKYLKLNSYLIITAFVDHIQGRDTESLLENTFEALCGAIYLDQGFDVLKQFITNLIEETIDMPELIMNIFNHKSTLLNYYQPRGWGNPRYLVIKEEGPTNNRVYTMGLVYPKNRIIIDINGKQEKRMQYIPDFEKLELPKIRISINKDNREITEEFLAIGIGSTKKKGEQEAALKGYNLIIENEFKLTG